MLLEQPPSVSPISVNSPPSQHVPLTLSNVQWELVPSLPSPHPWLKILILAFSGISEKGEASARKSFLTDETLGNELRLQNANDYMSHLIPKDQLPDSLVEYMRSIGKETINAAAIFQNFPYLSDYIQWRVAFSIQRIQNTKLKTTDGVLSPQKKKQPDLLKGRAPYWMRL